MKRLWFLQKNRVDLSSISEVRSYITARVAPFFLAHPVFSTPCVLHRQPPAGRLSYPGPSLWQQVVFRNKNALNPAFYLKIKKIISYSPRPRPHTQSGGATPWAMQPLDPLLFSVNSHPGTRLFLASSYIMDVLMFSGMFSIHHNNIVILCEMSFTACSRVRCAVSNHRLWLETAQTKPVVDDRAMRLCRPTTCVYWLFTPKTQ